MNRSQRKQVAKKEGSLSNQIKNRVTWIRWSFLEDLFQSETEWTYLDLFKKYDQKWRDFAETLNKRKLGFELDPDAFHDEFKPLEGPKLS